MILSLWRRRRARIPVLRGDRMTAAIPLATVRLYAIVLGAAVLILLFLVYLLVRQHSHDVQLQSQRHDQRVADQKRTDYKIAVLACGQARFFLQLDPGNVRAQQYARSLDAQYQCSTLSQRRPGASSSSSPSPSPSGTQGLPGQPSPAPSTQPSSSAAVVVQGTRPAHAPTPTHIRTTPAPQPTSSTPPPGRPSSPPTSRPTPAPTSSSPVVTVRVPIVSVPPVCVGRVICING